jgi:hypothetical protein
MAARAMTIPGVCTGTAVWHRFRSLAEHHITEGNLTAGEQLWEVVQSDEASNLLIIRSTRWTADSIECALDLKSGALTCAPGSAICTGPLKFQLVQDKPGMVRRRGKEFTIDEAVQLVLSELVWVDDADCAGEGLES